MAGKPGYYLVTLGANGEPTLDVSASPPTYDPIVSGGLVTFPVAGQHGGSYNLIREMLAYKTERGRSWNYERFELRDWKITFRVSPAQLEIFRTLDIAVGGNRDPFLFVPDVTTPTTRIFCRKEKDFSPVQLSTPVLGAYYDYTLEISEEPSGVSVAV